jgi:hypothetical protein
MAPSPYEEQGQRYILMEERSTSMWRSPWLIGGLAAVGLGLLAWYTFGPDLRRYLKIKSM